MLFSLAQTLVCVLIIQSGLYALHLSGSSNGGTNLGNNNGAGSNANNPNGHVLHILGGNGPLQHPQHSQHSQHHVNPNAERLAEEIADFAQMERERLMLLDLAKQTAAAVNAASSTSHHGRPIITGRIQMTPDDEMDEDVDDIDYPGVLMPQSQRNYMFGSIVKQAPRHGDDYDSAEEFDGGGRYGDLRRPLKYEYGREVQSQDQEFDQPQHMDMDGFMDVEVAEPDVDDMIPDLDGYQYLDELLADQHKNWNDGHHFPAVYASSHHRYPQNPYSNFDQVESKPPQALQELFDMERERAREQQHERAQHDEPIAGAALSATSTGKNHKELLPQARNSGAAGVTANGSGIGIGTGTGTGNGYKIRLQQQWQRKRNLKQQQQQQQQQKQHQPHLQRNIFGGHQKHHFNSLQQAKFSLANSEATATKHIGVGKNGVANSASSSSDMDAAMKTTSQQSNSNKSSVNSKSTAAAADASAASPWSPSSSSSSTLSLSSPSSSSLSSLSSASASASESAASTTHHNNGEAGTMAAAKERQLQSNHKRSGGIGGGSFGSVLQPPPLAHSIASQLMLRTARGQRQYDVPQIECPSAMDGMERFACPTPDLQGRYRCIDDHVLCDGFIDCPEGEDEDRRSCMFYKTTKAHLDVLADALLRWARGR